MTMNASFRKDDIDKDIRLLESMLKDCVSQYEDYDYGIDMAKAQLDDAMEVVERKRRDLDDAIRQNDIIRMQIISYNLAILRARQLISEPDELA